MAVAVRACPAPTDVSVLIPPGYLVLHENKNCANIIMPSAFGARASLPHSRPSRPSILSNVRPMRYLPTANCNCATVRKHPTTENMLQKRTASYYKAASRSILRLQGPRLIAAPFERDCIFVSSLGISNAAAPTWGKSPTLPSKSYMVSVGNNRRTPTPKYVRALHRLLYVLGSDFPVCVICPR